MTDPRPGLEDAQRSRDPGSGASGLPPGLEDFGVRLEQAARRDVSERRRSSRDRRRLRDLGLPLAAALAAAAVSAGAVHFAEGPGDPIAPEPAYQAPKDAAVIESSAAANPSGGPPWVVRAFSTETGRECIQIGRLRAGIFGQVQASGFRALPASAPGSCANSKERGPRVAVSRRPSMNLTVVYGLAVDPTPVSIRFGALHQQVTPAGFGAFVAVFERADPALPIVVTSRAGGRLSVRTFE